MRHFVVLLALEVKNSRQNIELDFNEMSKMSDIFDYKFRIDSILK